MAIGEGVVEGGSMIVVAVVMGYKERRERERRQRQREREMNKK